MFTNIFSNAFDVNEACEDSAKQIIIIQCKVTKSKQCGQRHTQTIKNSTYAVIILGGSLIK